MSTHEVIDHAPGVERSPAAAGSSSDDARSTGPGGGGALAVAPSPAAAQPVTDRPRHLRVVAPDERSPAQHQRRVRALALASVVVAIAVAFGLVGVHVMLAQNQFRLDKVDAQATAQQSRYERLQLQVDQLESPQRIVATAEQKLGMVLPPSITYLAPSAPTTAGNGAGGPGPASSSSTAPGATATTAATATTPTTDGVGATVPPPAGAGAWSTIKPLLVPNK